MLVQFSVENFLSFDEEQVFSMLASGGDQHPEHLIPDTPRKGEAVLRAAAFYGANGAGKSNFVHAIRFAKNLVVNGLRSKQAIPVRPFKLNGVNDRSSKFEFIIKTQGVLYNYGFRLDARRIIEEWLYGTPNKQEVKYFERRTLSDGKAEVTFGSNLAGKTSKQKQYLEFVAQGTWENQLFITKAEDNKVAELLPVFNWFKSVCLIISPEAISNSLEIRAHTNKQFIDFLGNFLSNADTGIDRVTTKEIPFNFDRYFPEASDELRDEVQSAVSGLKKNEAVVLQSNSGTRYILKRGNQDEAILTKLSMQHLDKNGKRISFEIQEESEGTQRLIHLMPALFSLLEEEKVVIIDELDRRLHPLVSRLVVQSALSSTSKNQLIFTTHDTNLLDLDLLRRDEIWFAEKDKGGATRLYSLAEFKPRADLKIEKGYLNGRFGAVPSTTNELKELFSTAYQDGTPSKMREDHPERVA